MVASDVAQMSIARLCRPGNSGILSPHNQQRPKARPFFAARDQTSVQAPLFPHAQNCNLGPASNRIAEIFPSSLGPRTSFQLPDGFWQSDIEWRATRRHRTGPSAGNGRLYRRVPEWAFTRDHRRRRLTGLTLGRRDP